MIVFQFPLFQNLTEKVSQYSDTTYSVVKGLGVDTTNKKLGLIIEGEGGADTLLPFSGKEPPEIETQISTIYANSYITFTVTNPKPMQVLCIADRSYGNAYYSLNDGNGTMSASNLTAPFSENDKSIRITSGGNYQRSVIIYAIF